MECEIIHEKCCITPRGDAEVWIKDGAFEKSAVVRQGPEGSVIESIFNHHPVLVVGGGSNDLVTFNHPQCESRVLEKALELFRGQDEQGKASTTAA